LKNDKYFPSTLDEFIIELINSNVCLDQEFNIDKLSLFLGIQCYLTSKLLKDKYRISFSKLKNVIRINHAVDQIKLGFLRLHTIEALAKECGYSERVHFSKTFKIFTGMTVAQADNYEKNNMVSTIITNENLEKKLG
jgi:AraC-like DNA-binding protein